MKDFTFETYRCLIQRLKETGYIFQCVADYINSPSPKAVILRHDVDIRNWAADRLALYENHLGIKSTYYFRYKRNGFDIKTIKSVIELGHEIGYHYEDLTHHNGNASAAIESFQRNLKELRKLYPVETICMHGRSGSTYDNRDLWKKYDYREFGVIAEPYLDLDFDKVLYLSDVARRWNGSKIALRDKVASKFDFDFKTTYDLLESIDQLPDRVMLTMHPELWTDNIWEWTYVYFFVIAHNFYKVHFRNKRTLKRNS